MFYSDVVLSSYQGLGHYSLVLRRDKQPRPTILNALKLCLKVREVAQTDAVKHGVAQTGRTEHIYFFSCLKAAYVKPYSSHDPYFSS